MLKLRFTFILVLLCSICGSWQTAQAQTLPDEMYLSSDGRTLMTGGQAATGLYDQSIIRTIDLNFSQANYWTLLTNNYDSKTEIPADMTVDGVTYPNVGVRFKGNTSYFQTGTSQKKSFNINMEYTDPNLDLMGYSTLNLNNEFQDPSMLREFIYLNQIRNYIPAAKAAFIHLNINGQSWGVYPNIQQINGDLINEWFLSNDGTRWRADTETTTGGGPGGGGGGPGGGGPGGGGPGGGGGGGGQWGAGTTALNFLGADTSLYQQHYTLKKTSKTNAWDDLVNVADVLNNTPLVNLEDSLEKVLDIDRTLWFLASEIVFTDDDGYVYKGEMDYHLYWEAETGLMVPLEYDGNSTMDPAKVNWTPFHNANNANYPLLNRMLAVPSIRQRYLAHFRTLIEESIDTSVINPIIRQYATLIDAEMQADPKKFDTYNDFLNEVDALQTFFSNRYNYLSSYSEVNVASPDISNVYYATNGQQWVKPQANQATTINASITSTNGIAGVTLYYSNNLVGNFESVAMFDDGQHGDGAANDGVYGADIPGFSLGADVRYYIEAEAADAAGTLSYMPKGAVHDVYYYNVVAGQSNNSSIVINEIMASNTATVADNAGDFDDWIELYNKSSVSVDLSGWYITDKTDNLTKYDIPSGTTIDANDYLIIWADEDSSQGPVPVHANFKLSKSGETLMLLDNFVLVVDSMGFGQQTEDMGYARVPNGTGNFVIQTPTFNGNNDNVSTSNVARLNDFRMFPNPTDGLFNIVIEGDFDENTFEVFDVQGRKVDEVNITTKQFQVDASNWGSGLFVLKYGDTVKRMLILK